VNPWTQPPFILSLSPGQVIVWKACLDWPPERLAACLGWLDPAERQRAGRFHFPIDRERFIARRLLLRAILGRSLGLAPAQVVYHPDAYGKLWLAPENTPARGAGVCFNASHSAGLALVALARQNQLGVDLERIRAEADLDDVAARFFSPQEHTALQALAPGERPAAFFAAWTRKEAYLKALGQGLSLPLDAFDVSLEPGQPARLLAARQGLPGPESWSLLNLDPAPGYAGALCVQAPLDELLLWSIDNPLDWVTQSAG